MTEASLQLYREALAEGFGDKDQSIIMEQLKRMHAIGGKE